MSSSSVPTNFKRLTSLEIYPIAPDSRVIEIADTVDDNKATRALNEFKNYGTMHEERNMGEVLMTTGIPYHAIKYIKATTVLQGVDGRDPYGCEDPNEDSNEDPNPQG